jgi:lipopolysaccharide export system protein LptA
MFKRGFISLLLCCTQVVPPLLAADLTQGGAGDPIHVTSDRMMVKSAEDRIDFEGHVFIRKEGLQIETDRALLFLAPTNGDLKSGGVIRIEMEGDLRIQQGPRRAEAQRGVYDQKKQEIVLTGAPVAWERDYRVKGETITLFIAEQRTQVEKSEVTIQPKNQPKKSERKEAP